MTSATPARALSPSIGKTLSPPPPSRGQTPPAGDVFKLDTPDKAGVFPALNPLLFKTLEFDVEMAGVADAALNAPLHLTIGKASGDVTYSMPLNTNQLTGKSTVAGQDFEETWTFGPQLKIDGHLGATEEHLTAVYSNSSWHVAGTVGQFNVSEDIAEWDKTAAEGYNVDQTIGSQKLHMEYTQTHAGADGTWQTTMSNPPSSATGQFATLQDRHRFTASGQQGTTPWSASGDLIFTPDPNAPPPEG